MTLPVLTCHPCHFPCPNYEPPQCPPPHGLLTPSVNGIGTTGTGAQEIINHLHKLFHRPVTAVLNRSMGLWFDLIECILQRDLLMVTPDIRVGYHVRAVGKVSSTS